MKRADLSEKREWIVAIPISFYQEFGNRMAQVIAFILGWYIHLKRSGKLYEDGSFFMFISKIALNLKLSKSTVSRIIKEMKTKVDFIKVEEREGRASHFQILDETWAAKCLIVAGKNQNAVKSTIYDQTHVNLTRVPMSDCNDIDNKYRLTTLERHRAAQGCRKDLKQQPPVGALTLGALKPKAKGAAPPPDRLSEFMILIQREGKARLGLGDLPSYVLKGLAQKMDESTPLFEKNGESILPRDIIRKWISAFDRSNDGDHSVLRGKPQYLTSDRIRKELTEALEYYRKPPWSIYDEGKGGKE